MEQAGGRRVVGALIRCGGRLIGVVAGGSSCDSSHFHPLLLLLQFEGQVEVKREGEDDGGDGDWRLTNQEEKVNVVFTR